MSEVEQQKTIDQIRACVELEATNTGWNTYFRNFLGNLPNPNFPENESDVAGKSHIRSRWMDRFYKAPGIFDIKIGEKYNDPQFGFSDLLLSQTYRDFFFTIDQLIEELGLNGAIETYYRLEKEEPDKKTKHNEEFLKGMLPLYVRLLQMGYNYEDLTK